MTAWEWIQKMIQCWREKDIDGLQTLISDSVNYYEDPFSEPLVSWEEIRKEWEAINDQEILELSVEPLIEAGHQCMASYSLILGLKNGEQYVSKGAYFVEVDEQGKVVEFRQWWNERE